MPEREEVRRDWRRHAGWATLAAVLVLALWLRVHDLGRESVWYDEYITIAMLQPTGLADSIAEQRKLDWHMVPVYHTLQYFWWKVFGPSPLAVRWLSILFGVGAVALLYQVGKEIYGRTAGTIAALLLALAPFHVYHAQGIRPYALVLFLALWSVWTFLRATRGGGRGWWVANALANALLLWTHLVAVFMLAPQGLYLLLFHRKPWKRFVLWCGFHGLVVAGIAAWVATISGGEGSPKFKVGPPKVILNVLLRSDPGPLEWLDYILPKDLSEKELSATAHWVMDIRPEWAMRSARMIAQKWLGYAYATLAVLLPLLVTYRRVRQGPERMREAQETAFTLLWWVLPVVLLYAMAWMGEVSLFWSRFLIFALPAVYIIAGGALTRVGRPVVPVVGAMVLVALLSVQTVGYANTPVRHGYWPAAQHLKAHANLGHRVLTYTLYPYWLLDYNLGAHDFELVQVDREDQLLALMEESVRDEGSVWVVLLSTPQGVGGPDQAGLADRFQQELAHRGVPFDRHVYPGMQNVYLYRCYQPPADRAQGKSLE